MGRRAEPHKGPGEWAASSPGPLRGSARQSGPRRRRLHLGRRLTSFVKKSCKSPPLFGYHGEVVPSSPSGDRLVSLELHVIAGPDKDRRFTLNVGENLMLGRAGQAHYQLSDPRVSRNHCQILLEGEDVVVACNSGSGTFVNGQKIQRQKLKMGDTVQVGDTKLRLQVGDLPLDVALAQTAGAQKLVKSTAKNADHLTSLAGTTLAHFDINMVIGVGRSCVVFNATDTKDNRPVALKVLQPEFANDDEEVQRFVRAIKTMLPLRHPNLVSLYAAGKTGNYCWVSMEYIAGENMQEVIDRIGVAGMLDWRHAYKAAVHVGKALEYAHGQSILHRNVTPTNILLEATSKTVKLGDLMLAKAMEGILAKQITRPARFSVRSCTCRRNAPAAPRNSTPDRTCTAWARRYTLC